MKPILFASLAAMALSCVTLPVRAQHGHLNAGALGTNQNDRLYFANGADFIASSGYTKTLDYTNAGRFAGYYQQNITLTALPATAAFAGPDPNAAALGSQIQFSMACLSGPPDGSFGFWDAGSTSPTLSLAAGESSSILFRVSENDGSAGADPYGHIHGRRFSATKPGLYKIGFTLFDTSHNGASGGPIHLSSEQLPIWFQAGVNVISVEPDNGEGHVHIRFAPPANTSWQVEASPALGSAADWQPVGNPIPGNDLVVELIHDSPSGSQRFYRLKQTSP